MPKVNTNFEDLYEDITDEEEKETEEAEDKIGENYYPVEYSISSYGADYPVDGLVKRIESGSIFIPPFQRGFVWNIYRASRFIESLLLGLPVPAIFLSREEDSQKLLVIDGQQRLRTLQYFYRGIFGDASESVFKLREVHKRFNGQTYKSLSEGDRIRLDDSIIHAIIVKQEKPLDEEPSSIYHIFERLNTGGVLLQPQEIRTCIYYGSFSKLLDDLNQNQKWRKLFGKLSTRMRDRELILRFFALLYKGSDYSKPMKEFLNVFMEKNRNIDVESSLEMKRKFEGVVDIIDRDIGEKAFKPKKAVNVAIADSIMVGIATNLANESLVPSGHIKQSYQELLKDSDFEAAYNSATTDEASVQRRIELAMKYFRAIK